MKPSKVPLKRTPMSNVSQKQRKRIRETKAFRAEMRRKHHHCWACGKFVCDITVHEIAKGVHRTKALDQPYALLMVCWECNRGPLNDYSIWPIARQLACLLVHGQEHFDLIAFNRLRGRADDAITMREVDAWMPEIL